MSELTPQALIMLLLLVALINHGSRKNKVGAKFRTSHLNRVYTMRGNNVTRKGSNKQC